MSTQEYGSERESPNVPGEQGAAEPGRSPKIYSDEWWENFAKQNPRFGDTVEKVRDTLDYGWRTRRRLKEAAELARRRPAREIDPNLGRVPSRSYRQVNVKLGEADFAALTALAVDRDLPPATMARMLLRKAIKDSES